MKKLLALLSLTVFAGMAAATTVSSERVRVDLEDSSVDVSIDVERLTTEKFTYLTSYEVTGLKARSSGRILDCSVSSLQIGSEITCDPPRKTNFTVRLSFTGSGFVTRQGKASIFRYSHSVYRPTENYTMKVLLPEDGRLLEPGNLSTPVVSPKTGQASSNGRRIFVTWDEKPDLGDTLNFQVVYERFSTERNFLYYGTGAFGVLLVVLLTYLGYRYWNREDIESVYGDIPEDGVEVLEIIRDNGGKMLQKNIVKETDYSKAKVSGIVSDLVERNIITKEKDGRSNMLSISRNYRS